MVSVLFTIGGAVINALSFSVTNFLFSKLKHHGGKQQFGSWKTAESKRQMK